MKFILFAFVLLYSTILMSQTNTYSYVSEKDNHLTLKYTLNLLEDGTFNFHMFRHVDETQPKENYYGRGKWSLTGKVIALRASGEDINDKFTYDFDGAKARIDKKSPRDKSDRIVPETLLFFKSKIKWVEGLKLSKI